ncbi:lipid-A-disaccharide synthase N-terminal domain-containing protein [Candidatus Sumerlaeota bacterium]|nr:lipid-A-disaccharide synthase N-terminal domain-containing protein [Candidatus Sumerlaeota bacterium]
MITPDPTLFSFRLYSSQEIVVTAWTFIGLVGNALFTARVLIQWIASEKQRRSIAPVTFWWTSLAATLIMVFYSIQRLEVAFLLGYTINIVAYVRNLMLASPGLRPRHVVAYALSAVVFVTGAVFVVRFGREALALTAPGHAAAGHGGWLYLGLAGNLIFNTRFLLQWIYSERKKASVLPLWFWVWSLVGQMLCLVYALILHDLVFILGFIFNGIPIGRNIMLCLRHAEATAESH